MTEKVRKQPRGKTKNGMASTSARELSPAQKAAATNLYNAFGAAGSKVKLAEFAVGMADLGVWSKKEAADTLGITTTQLKQAKTSKEGTGATDERREALRRLAANRLGLEFKETAFAVTKRQAAAARQAAGARAKAAGEPAPIA